MKNGLNVIFSHKKLILEIENLTEKSNLFYFRYEKSKKNVYVAQRNNLLFVNVSCLDVNWQLLDFDQAVT